MFGEGILRISSSVGETVSLAWKQLWSTEHSFLLCMEMFMHGQGSAEVFLVNSNTFSFQEIQVKTIRAKGSGSESHFRIST